jgi:1-acyl-sn-glycerol-3-phosphate acyltransferase
MKPTLVWNIGRVICRPFTSRVFDLKVYGRKHVPKTGGVLIVSNHQSYLDPVLFGVQLDRPMSYLAKSELFENPVLSLLIRSLNAFPVQQGKGDVGAVKETISRLKEGHMLNIYPEGTRTLDGELAEIQSGVALVIRRAGVPVVPAVIEGSYEAWPKGAKIFHRHPIRVMYGPPLAMTHMKGPEIVQTIDTTFKKMIAELRAKGNCDHV